jgi:hypothetical protein
MNRHTDKTTGRIVGRSLVKELEDRTTLAKLRKFLSKDELNLLQKFAKTVELTQEKTGAKGAPVAMAMIQAGAVTTLGGSFFFPERVRTPAQVGALAVLMGPAMIGKLMTSPTGIKLLTEGFELGAKGKIGFGSVPSFISRLGAKMTEIGQKAGTLNQGK